ncbi:RhuM family protein [Bacteroides sp. 224]|uniref:RhuM family protein n=1 Tax=Bacteroides sp. 224 TaxID=2302936 RepID=UPI0013D21175|nr:RhuM family protein [Bacteroides sp. 224]NDV67185.1 cell filamentation protein Fic [Bacteroides sp. 224]
MNNDQLLIYQSQDGNIKIDVLFEGETVWLSQEQMGILYNRERSVITKHIQNVFKEGELDEKSNVHFLHIANSDKPVKYYNLDVIISVGYRVKSQQGTQFRIWATQRLRDYIIKGFALNDERFKTGSSMNYFKELLERIREIRISERMFYQQIKEIYKTSIDYDPSDEQSTAFFKEVQNKLLWAVSGKTAAELIYYRANASLPMMGLTSTEKADKVLKSDIKVGKNYLKEEELNVLKLIVEQFLAYAEAQALAHKPMYMKDWIEKLKLVLMMNEKSILEDAGRISHQLALSKANQEYEQYKEKQRAIEHLNSIRELANDIEKLQKGKKNNG